MARDFRGEGLAEYQIREALEMKGAQFQWTRWQAPHERWDHDHCRICWACICDGRDRFKRCYPGFNDKREEEDGHYRHAYRAELGYGSPVWVCRSCFKRLAPIAHWTVQPRAKASA